MKVREFRDFGPVPWWIWSGKLEHRVMLRQLETMKAAGIDEFFIYPSMGLEYPNFLEESWFKEVGWTLEQAKALNMRVWIYDDMNWPSGTAMGNLAKWYPQYRLRSIVPAARTLSPGQKFSFNTGYGPIRTFIREKGTRNWQKIELDDNQYVNNTGKELEMKTFEVQICNYPSLGVRGILNTWYQGGFCDLLNPDAVKAWMHCIHDKYYEHFKDECGKTLMGFFYDEPYFQPNPAGELPWTDGIVEMFQARYGYNFLDHLCEFYEYLPGSEKFRSDFWTWFVERIGESFSTTIANWCAERNLLSTGHCVFEELADQNSRLICCGEPHEVIRHNQIPGMDMLMDPSPFFHPLDVMFIGSNACQPGNYLFTAKQAGSTGRYCGSQRVMCESCGVLHPNVRIGREKYTFSWIAACGVSMMNENNFQYSICSYKKRCSGNKNFGQPWLKHYGIFAEAVRELSRFGTGLLQTEVCVLCPESTIRACTTITANRIPLDEGRVEPEAIGAMDNLMRNFIDFEVMFEEVLQGSPAKDGKLLAPHSAFKVMVIPHAPVLRPEIAAKVQEFIQCGGKVIFVGRRTERLPDGTPVDFSNAPLVHFKDVSAEVKKYVQLPYAIQTTGEIFSALRKCGDQLRLMLSNQSQGPADLRLTLNLPGPVVAKIVGDDTEWQFQGEGIHLHNEQVLLLTIGKTAISEKPSLEWGVLAHTAQQECSGPWRYTLDKPNNALTCFEMGLCPGDKEKDSAEAVTLWLPVTWDGMHDLDFDPAEYPYYWLRGKFIAEEVSVIPGLSLVCEQNEVVDVYVNGKKIEPPEEYPLWTPECVKYDISAAVKQGENNLLILCKTSIWAARQFRTIFALNCIEPIVLHGHFATRRGEPTARLFALPDQLTMGDLAAQGFPFYAGDVSYEITLPAGEKAPIVEVPDPGDGAVELWCNDQLVGAKIWQPYRFDMQSAWNASGANRLVIRLVGTIGNLFPRSYGNRKLDLRPIGLMEPVVIKP